jgi:hypothetical protein
MSNAAGAFGALKQVGINDRKFRYQSRTLFQLEETDEHEEKQLKKTLNSVGDCRNDLARGKQRVRKGS